MEKMILKYPHYIPEQFLTSSNLNDSFSYLEQQERFTRSLLAGSGIISGLVFSHTLVNGLVTEIILQKGYGVTTEGILVGTDVEEKFTAVVSLEEAPLAGAANLVLPFKKGFRLLTPEQAASDTFAGTARKFEIPLSTLAGNYLLLLFVEIKEVPVKKCSPGECNTVGADIEIDMVPVLGLREKPAPVQNAWQPQPFVFLEGLQQISRIKTADEFRTKTNGMVKKNLELLRSKIEALLQLPEPAVAPAELKKAKEIMTTTAAFQFREHSFNNQYYLNFARDLQKAVNEFLTFYNKTSLLHEPLTTFYPQTLVLGGFPFLQPDPERNLFRPALPHPSVAEKADKLNQLFARIFILIKHFLPEEQLFGALQTAFANNLAARIRITPGQAGAMRLGKRSVPFYYNLPGAGTSHELLSWWDTSPSSPFMPDVFSYWDITASDPVRRSLAEPLLTDQAAANFYRIEGHVGLPPEAAHKTLLAKIETGELPIQLEIIDLSNKFWFDFREKFQEFLKNYNLFVGELKKLSVDPAKADTYLAYRKKFEKLNVTLNDTSYKNTTILKTDLNNVSAFSQMFVTAAGTATTGETARTAEPFRFDQQISQEVVKLMDKYKILDRRKELAGLLPKATDKVEPSLKDFTGLEYLGGVVKGGTFILLHNGTQVVGDFALPYLTKPIK